LIQLAVVAYRLKHTTPEHSLLSKRLGVLKKYGNLLTVIEKKRYSALLLAGIGDSLLIGGNSAAVSIQKLSRLVSAFDNRLNLLAALFLEGILLWDIQCMIRLERWKSVQGRHLTEWIDAIGEFDAYSSLANFSFNHQQFSVPEFSDRAIIETSGMGHVLIPPDECILNDFTITNAGDFIIITGANMAGKSTFLRTVVTNMILAFAGAPVCAEKFSVKPITLFSSMRTNDSLNKHESYFYAELKRLKELLDRMRNGEKLFVVLDEILKGTNSTDKQRGSRSALEQILMLGGTGIIATHDLELATIEKLYPGKVKNMCFEIEIDRAEISFDYKLRGGITTKMNALLLMQQMGIVPEGYHTD
jgi:DNA mismatch repair ATPase MutS